MQLVHLLTRVSCIIDVNIKNPKIETPIMAVRCSFVKKRTCLALIIHIKTFTKAESHDKNMCILLSLIKFDFKVVKVDLKIDLLRSPNLQVILLLVYPSFPMGL